MINGLFKNAFAYFHLHPQISIKKNQINKIHLKMPNDKEIILNIKIGKYIIKESYYSAEFGKRIETKCIKIELDRKKGSRIEISW